MSALEPLHSALPEPLRQLGLSLPLGLYALLLAALFLGSLILRVAPLPASALRSETLSRLFLLGLLSALPWLRSLLWLPFAWSAATWVGALPDVAERAGGPACPVRASARFLRRGLLADGILCLACALFFWAQGGAWSRAGAGYVVDAFPRQPAQEHAGQIGPLPTLHLDLSAETVLSLPGPEGLADPGYPSLHRRLGHKLFYGLPLSAALLVLFLAALLLKLASGAALLRGVDLAQILGSRSRSLGGHSLLLALSPIALSLHLWLCLRSLW